MTVTPSKVYVYGASGHGKVIADILRACGTEPEGFIDDDPKKSGSFSEFKVLGDGQWLLKRASEAPIAVALGIGDNIARHLIARQCTAAGIAVLTVIHPSAVISASAKIADGVTIMPHVTVNAYAVIGRGAILNTGVIVEHDCEVGPFSHLSPGATIGGKVCIGEYAWLGIRSSVIPGRKIGTGAIVGAGSTVVRDVEDWVAVLGTPARFHKHLERRIEG